MNEVFEDVTKLLEENGYSIRDYLREVGVHGSTLMNLSSEAQEEFNRYYDQLIVGVTENQQFKVKVSWNNALLYVKNVPHPPFWSDVMLWIIPRPRIYSDFLYHSDRRISATHTR